MEVSVDYSGFAGAFGGDWSSRLVLVTLPVCALSTPEEQECTRRTVLDSANDEQAQQVSAQVSVSDQMVVALTAGDSGPAGDWAATPLSPSSSWGVSTQTGDFTWSYPLQVPPANGGPAPALGLSYASGQVDGRVSTTNNQTSWVGEGWSLGESFIERKYVTCEDDITTGSNNAGHKTADLCWGGDNATMSFAGHSGQLVQVGSSGLWRLKDDDGTRIEHLTGGPSGVDDDGEFWRVTTGDGTQYFFGRGKRTADGLALGSVWSVPVFGNDVDEACHQAAFADSWCQQAWRWNLDYVLDTSGNTMTYRYLRESNSYGLNNNTSVVSYTAGGYLQRIEYGQRTGGEAVDNASQRVLFEVAERCLPTEDFDCAPGKLTAVNAGKWPDVPFDQICTSATTCPDTTSPVFFSRKRLTAVTTQVLTSGGFQDVDSWQLSQTYPDPGDGYGPALWLNAIWRTGKVGTAITLPKTTFTGHQMAGRVAGQPAGYAAMNRYRIDNVRLETGGVIDVKYTSPCTSIPAAPQSAAGRCMPVKWTPPGVLDPILEYFNKYQVASVTADPVDDASAKVVTTYTYKGDAAWHYDDTPLVPEDQRTWGQWRGYGTVAVTTGAATGTRSYVEYSYLRGMNGDHLPSGTRYWCFTGSSTSACPAGSADEDRFNGFLREQRTYDGRVGHC